jgi:PHP family Zn ribbon phosphoesterase
MTKSKKSPDSPLNTAPGEEKSAIDSTTAVPLKAQIEKTRSPRSKSYVMDLRVHSPASLGYLGVEGLDSAPAIVRLAKVKGLDVIAITDFYSGEFVDRLVAAAKNSPLTIIPGVDLRCKLGVCDDVILSCLFPESFTTENVNEFLRAIKVPRSVQGNKTYLLATPLDEILHAVEQFRGVALPTRMDKTPHRMAAIPELVETYGFRAFDLAYADSGAFFKKRWPKIRFQLFAFSDANALAQIGSRIARIKLTNPGFDGIREVVAREAQLME